MKPNIGEVWIVKLEAYGIPENTYDLVYIQNDLEKWDSLVIIDSNENLVIEDDSLGESYDCDIVVEFTKRVRDAEIYEVD